MQILVIDRDRQSYEWLAARLQVAGFKATYSPSPDKAISDSHVGSAVAMILDNDAATPETGLRNVRYLRRAGVGQPLLVLSGVRDWSMRVEHLDAGADDFVVKPVRTEEIAARLRAIVRRSAGQVSSQLAIGDILLDIQARCAWRGGCCLQLTRLEFRLLQLLMLNPERAMSQKEIRDYLAPEGRPCGENATEVLVARLRKKVGRDRIQTQRGMGYRLIEGGEAPQHQYAPCRSL